MSDPSFPSTIENAIDLIDFSSNLAIEPNHSSEKRSRVGWKIGLGIGLGIGCSMGIFGIGIPILWTYFVCILFMFVFLICVWVGFGWLGWYDAEIMGQITIWK